MGPGLGCTGCGLPLLQPAVYCAVGSALSSTAADGAPLLPEAACVLLCAAGATAVRSLSGTPRPLLSVTSTLLRHAVTCCQQRPLPHQIVGTLSLPSPPTPTPTSTLTPTPTPTSYACLAPRAGIVQRKWVWALIFSPLWASTFINFGLGPVVTRTDDIAPVAANTAAFLLTAGAFVLREPLSKALRPPQNPGEGQ